MTLVGPDYHRDPDYHAKAFHFSFMSEYVHIKVVFHEQVQKIACLYCVIYLAEHDELVVGSHVPYPAASVLSLS